MEKWFFGEKKYEPSNLQAFHSLRFLQQYKLDCNGKEVTPNEKAIKAHRLRLTSFAGGKFHFPYEQRDHVLNRMALDAKIQCPMYYNQIAYEDEGMRLAIDFDSERVISPEEILHFAIILQQLLCDFYTQFQSQPIMIFVSKSGPRLKRNHDQLSVGVHIICHVAVTLQQARQLIFSYNYRLVHDNSVNMDKLKVDAGIYRDEKKPTESEPRGRPAFVNLRPIYCYKLDPCHLSSHSDFCICKIKGQENVKISSRFPYVPQFVLCNSNTIDAELFSKYHSSFHDMFRNHSLWTMPSDHRTDYVLPLTEPKLPSPPSLPIAGVIAGVVKIDHTTKSNPIHIAYEPLEEYIRSLDIHHWREVRIYNIQRPASSKSKFIINLTGKGSGQCPFAKKDHGATRLFFILSIRTMQVSIPSVYRCTDDGCTSLI
jgi:hypothetical protein